MISMEKYSNVIEFSFHDVITKYNLWNRNKSDYFMCSLIRRLMHFCTRLIRKHITVSLLSSSDSRKILEEKSHLPLAYDISWMVNVVTQHDIETTTTTWGDEDFSYRNSNIDFFHFSTSMMPNLVLIILMHFYIISIMIKDIDDIIAVEFVFPYNFSLPSYTSRDILTFFFLPFIHIHSIFASFFCLL